jgi:hypothetical protein
MKQPLFVEIASQVVVAGSLCIETAALFIENAALFTETRPFVAGARQISGKSSALVTVIEPVTTGIGWLHFRGAAPRKYSRLPPETTARCTQKKHSFSQHQRCLRKQRLHLP